MRNIDNEHTEKDFIDMVMPSTIRFYTDYYICGNTYRCVWAMREYPTTTSEQALLRHLGEKDGVTLKIYTRHVSQPEEKRIFIDAYNKNKMCRNDSNDFQESVTAENNLQDMVSLIEAKQRSREPFLHTAVYIELSEQSIDELKLLQTDVLTELVRSKLNVDRLILRQQEGFKAVMPCGFNSFGSQFERVLPASSTANLFPFNYSGKTDADGFCLGKDKFGSNIIVDFDKRTEDKTNANVLILGNSGQGKSYLLKLILCNLRESGKDVICLDAEHEYQGLTENLGGCFLDLMTGEYIINPLQPKAWSGEANGKRGFAEKSNLSRHISFLRDFFASYKEFTGSQLDVIEIMLQKLYEKFGITDNTNLSKLKPKKCPILSDLYDLIQAEYDNYSEEKRELYTESCLRDILLALNGMCKGAESKFFNGYTNITDNKFLTFGVKGLLQASDNVKNAILFNVLSYMWDALLTKGNTAASLDEFYLFLSNPVAVEYIRNFMKRVRKKESSVILASQNLEDFNLPEIREFTKPLFSIPTHQFLFNAGTIDSSFYTDTLQLEQSEYELIKYPQRGVCLYKCGNERYNLMVQAPEYKSKLFGNGGGR